jgi:hypothetical protein
MSEIDVKALADRLVARAAEARALAYADAVALDEFVGRSLRSRICWKS